MEAPYKGGLHAESRTGKDTIHLCRCTVLSPPFDIARQESIRLLPGGFAYLNTASGTSMIRE